jgi:subtilisin family serine protease
MLYGAKHSSRRAKAQTEQPTKYYPLIIEIANDDALSRLNDAGAVIYYRRANLLLAALPQDSIGVLNDDEFFDAASIAKQTSLTNDVARAFVNVNTVHTGSELLPGYDGTGVVCGICDVGFDPAHIAFKDKLGMMSVYKETEAERSIYAPGTAMQTTTELIATDNAEYTHATHTSNTLAGARANNPYYGVAPGADLAVSLSDLSSMSLLCGIEDVIAYAKEVNKPAAINLSVSSFNGPHDGTDLFNKYLDEVSKDAIICFSAGNEGGINCSIQHDFSGDTIGTMIESLKSYDGFDIAGYMDFWSNDASPFKMQLVAYDQIDKKFIYESPWIGSDSIGDEGRFVLSTAGDEVWGAAFPDSYMVVYYDTDRHNGRYNMAISFELNPTDELPGHHWARYICGWRIKADTGVHVEGFADGIQTYFRAYGVPGMSDGNAKNSINNLCCNRNVISVGACNSRSVVPVAGGDDKDHGIAVGTVSAYNSHGYMPDGTELPLICAPGNLVVSATSAPYLEQNECELAHTAIVDGKTYAWHASAGTSMAAPIVTGIVALWLQAVPTLTVQQAAEAMTATAVRNFSDIADARWGAGCIDAYAGLKYLLQTDGISNVAADSDDNASTEYFTTQGIKLAAPTAPGIYIRRQGAHSDKFILK